MSGTKPQGAAVYLPAFTHLAICFTSLTKFLEVIILASKCVVSDNQIPCHMKLWAFSQSDMVSHEALGL